MIKEAKKKEINIKGKYNTPGSTIVDIEELPTKTTYIYLKNGSFLNIHEFDDEIQITLWTQGNRGVVGTPKKADIRFRTF